MRASSARISSSRGRNSSIESAGNQRLLRSGDLPPRRAEHQLELLLALARQDVRRALRALVAAAALVHGDATVLDQRADRAVDRAGLDVRRLLEAPADELAADD